MSFIKRIAGKVKDVIKKRPCIKCGKEISADSLFCKFCGKKQ